MALEEMLLTPRRLVPYVCYLVARQAPDGVVQLISSRQHYAFNLAWLKTPAPAAAESDDAISGSNEAAQPRP